MKAIALTTALITAIAAPAFAGNQLEDTLGVAPGTYSNAQLVALYAASDDDGNEGRLFAKAAKNNAAQSAEAAARAGMIFEDIAAASDEGHERKSFGASESAGNVSTKSVNARAEAIFALLAEESKRSGD